MNTISNQVWICTFQSSFSCESVFWYCWTARTCFLTPRCWATLIILVGPYIAVHSGQRTPLASLFFLLFFFWLLGRIRPFWSSEGAEGIRSDKVDVVADIDLDDTETAFVTVRFLAPLFKDPSSRRFTSSSSSLMYWLHVSLLFSTARSAPVLLSSIILLWASLLRSFPNLSPYCRGVEVVASSSGALIVCSTDVVEDSARSCRCSLVCTSQWKCTSASVTLGRLRW